MANNFRSIWAFSRRYSRSIFFSSGECLRAVHYFQMHPESFLRPLPSAFPVTWIVFLYSYTAIVTCNYCKYNSWVEKIYFIYNIFFVEQYWQWNNYVVETDWEKLDTLYGNCQVFFSCYRLVDRKVHHLARHPNEPTGKKNFFIRAKAGDADTLDDRLGHRRLCELRG